MKTINLKRADIPKVIEAISKKGARPISVILRSEKILLRKDRVTGLPHKLGFIVFKVAKYQAILNTSYENSVNNQREREEKVRNFKAGQSWFLHDNPNARSLVRVPNSDKQYLQLKVEKRLSSKYISEKGKPLQEKDIKNLLYKPQKAFNQGLDKNVLVISPKLESILELTFDKTRYKIV